MAETPRAWLHVTRDELVDAERSPRFLRLRSVTMSIEAADGARTGEGTWDFVERPLGLDAVVVVVYRRDAGRVEVLLRQGLRVPVGVGRPGQPSGPGRHPAVFVEEIVAGLVEHGEHGPNGLAERARVEVAEETGYELAPSAVRPLGAPLWASPGLCAEVLHFFAADATGVSRSDAIGDGSPFEAVGEIAWYPVEIALDRIAKQLGGVGDLRAELGIRRLAEQLRVTAS